MTISNSIPGKISTFQVVDKMLLLIHGMNSSAWSFYDKARPCSIPWCTMGYTPNSKVNATLKDMIPKIDHWAKGMITIIDTFKICPTKMYDLLCYTVVSWNCVRNSLSRCTKWWYGVYVDHETLASTRVINFMFVMYLFSYLSWMTWDYQATVFQQRTLCSIIIYITTSLKQFISFRRYNNAAYIPS